MKGLLAQASALGMASKPSPATLEAAYMGEQAPAPGSKLSQALRVEAIEAL